MMHHTLEQLLISCFLISFFLFSFSFFSFPHMINFLVLLILFSPVLIVSMLINFSLSLSLWNFFIGCQQCRRLELKIFKCLNLIKLRSKKLTFGYWAMLQSIRNGFVFFFFIEVQIIFWTSYILNPKVHKRSTHVCNFHTHLLKERARARTHTHTYIYIYIYI